MINGRFRDASIRPNIERIFKIWGERGVYDAEFVSELLALLSKLFYQMIIMLIYSWFYLNLYYIVIEMVLFGVGIHNNRVWTNMLSKFSKCHFASDQKVQNHQFIHIFVQLLNFCPNSVLLREGPVKLRDSIHLSAILIRYKSGGTIRKFVPAHCSS